MVGSIPSGTLKNNPSRGIHFTQAILAAFRAALQRFIVKRLMAVELYSTILTAIRINRHTSSLSERRMIIALFRLSDKTRPWLAYNDVKPSASRPGYVGIENLWYNGRIQQRGIKN
jgi:hypothetical protein